MQILIIDSDVKEAESVRDYLRMSDFGCDIAETGESGLKLALRNEYALVITEAEFSNTDGNTICRELRQEKDIPVIFLSNRSDEISVVRAFAAGADDYIKKPYSPSELSARVKGHIARYKALTQKNMAGKQGIISIKGLTIDQEARRVYVDNQEISMPMREFDLLLFLAENPNIVFSKERLFDRLWGMDAMGDVSTVTVHIQRIREKIESDECKYIETVWGVGYRFKA